jgi:hypothetical protein
LGKDRAVDLAGNGSVMQSGPNAGMRRLKPSSFFVPGRNDLRSTFT